MWDDYGDVIVMENDENIRRGGILKKGVSPKKAKVPLVIGESKKVQKKPTKETKKRRRHTGGHHYSSLPHPSIATLVEEAIEELDEGNGVSLQAIKKFMSDYHKVDTNKLGWFIRKYLRDAVDRGTLIHTTGHGATGHFRLTHKSLMPEEHPTRVSERLHPEMKKKKIKGKITTTATTTPSKKRSGFKNKQPMARKTGRTNLVPMAAPSHTQAHHLRSGGAAGVGRWWLR